MFHAPPFTADANFSSERLHDLYTAELVNTIGNCASRTTAMIGKYFEGAIPSESADQAGGPALVVAGADWPARSAEAACAASAAYEALDAGAAAQAAMGLVREVDVFIQSTEPFKVRAPEQTGGGRGGLRHCKTRDKGTIFILCDDAVRQPRELGAAPC